MTELVVIRHGETEWNAEGRIQGHQEVALNERGRRQAEALGRKYEEETAEAIYSSVDLETNYAV